MESLSITYHYIVTILLLIIVTFFKLDGVFKKLQLLFELTFFFRRDNAISALKIKKYKLEIQKELSYISGITNADHVGFWCFHNGAPKTEDNQYGVSKMSMILEESEYISLLKTNQKINILDFKPITKQLFVKNSIIIKKDISITNIQDIMEYYDWNKMYFFLHKRNNIPYFCVSIATNNCLSDSDIDRINKKLKYTSFVLNEELKNFTKL